MLAGKEYGSGSSRDWAAKGPMLLGISAVIAESLEKIHRSNLIGMGILPLEYAPGATRESLGLTGEESFTIKGLADLSPRQTIKVEAKVARRKDDDVRRESPHRHAGRDAILPPRRHLAVRPAPNRRIVARLPTLTEIRRATKFVHSVFPGTPQYAWPLLSKRLEAEVWVKHENDTPIGAFKVRGGLTYMHALAKKHPHVRGVITATRGNHGQSIAFAAARHGINATIVVPHGNSVEKNAAMRAFGAELVVFGRDFQEAAEYMQRLAIERQLHEITSFHPWLVRGVATYA